MNYNASDRYDRNRNSYHTHRSERYRHPEQGSNYRFDDYGDAAHGGYGNESYSGTFANQGDEGAGARHIANRGHHTYSTSQNYGNMGSYGGAQGFGSSRGGYGLQHRSGYGSEFESGRRNYNSGSGYNRNEDHNRKYGYLSDYDSHGQNSGGYNPSQGVRDLQDNYTTGRHMGRNQNSYSADNYTTRGYDQDRGSYRSSSYASASRPDNYGNNRGNYGSAGSYISSRSGSSNYNEPYGMRGYYRGGYSPENDYDSYARDRDERNNDW